MTKISEEFGRFLKGNYPDDYRRATVEDVEDSVVTSLMSKHERNFNVWKAVPDWIKDFYRDALPSEVFSGQEQLLPFVENLEQTVLSTVLYSPFEVYGPDYLAKNMTDNDRVFCCEAKKSGYSEKCIRVRLENRVTRRELLASGKSSTPEGRKEWRKTRERDCEAIKKDWQEHQQERMVFHDIKELDRLRRRFERVTSKKDKLVLKVKMAKTQHRINKYMKCVDDVELRSKLEKMSKIVQERPSRAELKEQVKNVSEHIEKPAQKVVAKKISNDVLSDVMMQIRG